MISTKKPSLDNTNQLNEPTNSTEKNGKTERVQSENPKSDNGSLANVGQPVRYIVASVSSIDETFDAEHQEKMAGRYIDLDMDIRTLYTEMEKLSQGEINAPTKSRRPKLVNTKISQQPNALQSNPSCIDIKPKVWDIVSATTQTYALPRKSPVLCSNSRSALGFIAATSRFDSWFNEEQDLEVVCIDVGTNQSLYCFNHCEKKIAILIDMNTKPAPFKLEEEDDTVFIPNEAVYELLNELSQNKVTEISVKFSGKDRIVVNCSIEGMLTYLIDPLLPYNAAFISTVVFTHKHFVSTQDLISILISIYNFPLPIPLDKKTALIPLKKLVFEYINAVRIRALNVLVKMVFEAYQLLSIQNIQSIIDFIPTLHNSHRMFGCFLCQTISKCFNSDQINYTNVVHHLKYTMTGEDIELIYSLFTLVQDFDRNFAICSLRNCTSNSLENRSLITFTLSQASSIISNTLAFPIPYAELIIRVLYEERQISLVRGRPKVEKGCMASRTMNISSKNYGDLESSGEKFASVRFRPNQSEVNMQKNEKQNSSFLTFDPSSKILYSLLGKKKDIDPLRSTILIEHKSQCKYLFGYHPLIIARQLAFFTVNLFRQISFDEMCTSNWTYAYSPPSFARIINFASKFCDYAFALLNEDTKLYKERAVNLMKIFKHSYSLGDFNTCFLLSTVIKLAKLGKSIDEFDTKFAKDVQDFGSPNFNFREYRKTISNSHPPFIPAFFIIYTDLTKIHEINPTFVNKTEKIINFSKLHLMKSIYRMIQLVIRCGYQFDQKQDFLELLNKFTIK